MSPTVNDLLAALEPLPHGRRLEHLARTARESDRRGELDGMLAELDRGGPYERRLAALAATVCGRGDFLAARLTDPDRGVSGYALRAARTPLVPDEAVEAAYEGASAATRRRLAGVLLMGRRTELAERMVGRLRAQWGDGEAARLLPACSAAFVRAHLPGLAHAVESGTRLAKDHPDPVLDQCERELAGITESRQRDAWWKDRAPAMAVLASIRPQRLLDLLERHGPSRAPAMLWNRFGPLIRADAERTVRWLLSPDRNQDRFEPLPSTGMLRKLVHADPPSLAALGRHWLRRQQPFVGLVKAMAPARRGAFIDAVAAGRELTSDQICSVLHLLPRERRWAQLRTWLAGQDDDGAQWFWMDMLEFRSLGPLDEVRPELLAALKRPDADDRAVVWPILVAATGCSADRAAMSELLDLMRNRLRNEQDPVRVRALEALAELRPGHFAAEDVPSLDRIVLDALEARDGSDASRRALCRLAVGVLAEHTTQPSAEQPALLDWALRALERITAHAGVQDLGLLYRRLRRGQEHQVFEALRPWAEAAAGRSEYRLLFSLAASFGPRARRMPELQRMLEDALAHGGDQAFATAAELWLDDPAARDERVARIVAMEPSAVVLGPVQRVLARRRTDLLDGLLGLGGQPPHGRFLRPGADRPLPAPGHSDRWTPRQQEAAVRLFRATATDTSRSVYERAAAIRAAAPVPEQGHRLVREFVDSPEVVVAEAALGALPWTDRPAAALGILLAHSGSDRARVAVYAAARAARFVPPRELAARLERLLTATGGVKVTSRKEAVRLAARYLPPAQAAELLAAVYRMPGRHADVAAAVIAVAPGLLDQPQMWEVLTDTAEWTPQTATALTAPAPWEVPDAHRPRYARLIGTMCEAADQEIAAVGLRALPKWVRFAPETAHAVPRWVTSLDERRNWRVAAGALRSVAASGLPHPVGGAAVGSLLRTTVAELLAVVRAGDGEVSTERDRPAGQRLESLVEELCAEPEEALRPVLGALADQLADEPSLIGARAALLRQLVDLDAELPLLHAQLTDLARVLRDHRLLASYTADRLCSWRAYGSWMPRDPATLLAAAERLAADGPGSAGLFAVALVGLMGLRLNWPEEWRGLLCTLRRHEDGDVRYAAMKVFLHHE
ncbi:hypothetical protein [Streptomyces sp. NPDC059828]|uniref:hypothetical protein n=1 Tax=Streptomyces sp. NPDC059828 TaxID=3346965 RepID=UPI003656D4D6